MASLPPQVQARVLGDAFAADMEHRCYEFLRIGEVCVLERVSVAWRRRVRRALRSRPWDVVHCAEAHVGSGARVWLAGLVRSAEANIRSLQMSNPLEALACASARGMLLVVTTLAHHFPTRVNEAVQLHGDFALDKLTPLHRAVRNGHLVVVKFLTTLPNVDASVPDGRQEVPMHIAAREGHLDVVRHFSSATEH